MLIKAALIAGFLTIPVHSWYDSDCCSGYDCKPVPCQSITKNELGQTVYNGKVIDKDKVRISQDNQCHGCPYCVYLPSS